MALTPRGWMLTPTQKETCGRLRWHGRETVPQQSFSGVLFFPNNAIGRPPTQGSAQVSRRTTDLRAAVRGPPNLQPSFPFDIISYHGVGNLVANPNPERKTWPS